MRQEEVKRVFASSAHSRLPEKCPSSFVAFRLRPTGAAAYEAFCRRLAASAAGRFGREPGMGPDGRA